MSTQAPNVLLFIADGLRAQALAPTSEVVAPHIRTLAQRGVQINNAYTPLPTCSPARASLMTGLLPHNHGVLQVEHVTDPDQSVLRADKPHWARRLQQAGYQTAYFGKWHIERTLQLQNFGWQISQPLGQQAHRQSSEQGMTAESSLDPLLSRYHQGPAGYNDTLHYGVTDVPASQRGISAPTDAACAYLHNAPTDQPWCCVASYYEPNEAMIVGRDAYEQYDVDTLRLPANLRDDFSDRPNIYQRQQQIFQDLSDDQWRQALACYYGRITEIDTQLGRLLTTLEQTNRLENTIILFTADHGKYVGSHGFEAHNFGPFEEIYNVPLIAAGPGIAQNILTDARVGFHDLCPTLIELAGAQPIDVPDSRSFAPLLKNPRVHESAFRSGYAEYHGTRFPLAQRIYWEDEWKFVFNGFDFDELYNLQQDPSEMSNLATRPEQADRINYMMGKIWERLKATNDRALANTHYYSMRFAAIGPNA
jgi:arylsulfatase A-like enzyme